MSLRNIRDAVDQHRAPTKRRGDLSQCRCGHYYDVHRGACQIQGCECEELDTPGQDAARPAPVELDSAAIDEAAKAARRAADVWWCDWGQCPEYQREKWRKVARAVAAVLARSAGGSGAEDGSGDLASCGVCRLGGRMIHINDDCAEHGDTDWYVDLAAQLPVEGAAGGMPDGCRPVNVTGEDGQEITVRVHGGEPMNLQAQEAFGELVRAAQRRYLREHPAVDERSGVVFFDGPDQALEWLERKGGLRRGPGVSTKQLYSRAAATVKGPWSEDYERLEQAYERLSEAGLWE